MTGKPYTTLAECEALRDIHSLYLPDSRNEVFGRFDDCGAFRPATAQDQLDDVVRFILGSGVPESVRVHFETAKNLYAYAWFVFRFHAVAEQQALASLEFALRERLTAEVVRNPLKGRRRPRGLSAWLEEARIRGVITNERLSWREAWALERAKSRVEFDQFEQMRRLGLTSMQFDYSDVQPSPDDLQHDWLGVFIDSLPKIRNTYAHGSTLLHPTVLQTFEIVSELINQLFSSAEQATD
ncbi:hypothetical protein [Paraburkholderia sediminicola]|uniref:hypothetical protein n=1 Tax=Paraburkholderia sediminicola TaxID=458836 RepID=UPI0038BCB4B8